MPKTAFLTYLFILLSFSLWSQNIEIDTLLNSGIKDNRINFAFANVDHATANSYEEKDEFISDLDELLERFDPNSPLSKSGFSHYRNFFNLYSVWFQDPYIFEPKPSYYIASQGTIDSIFLPWADDQHGWVTMMYSLKGGGGGGAGRRDDLRRGDALIWGLEWETILHEFNHTMPGVGDEYTASGEWSNFVCNESPNQTPALAIDDVPWRKWIEDGTPIPTPYEEEYFGKVGAFEGTISGYFGCQRPTAQSCYMGAGGFGEGFGTDMCSVCLQRFICRTYQFVDAIEEKSPSTKIIELEDEEPITFSVKTVKPIPNTQQYKWFLNGTCIAKDVETIDITFGDCELFEVRFELVDTTEFVRFDEKYAYLYPEPKQSYTWYVYGLIADYDLEATFTSINADCSGNDTGQLLVDAKGGVAPYTYFIDGKEYTSEINDLSPGTHLLSVVDANGCNFDQEVTIGQDPIFDFDIVSTIEEGVWNLKALFSEDVDVSDLSFTWSNGSTDQEIYTTEKGPYSLEVKTGEDCMVSKAINLIETPCENLEVEHILHHPTSEYDGAIYLDIKYGSEPYSIHWYKNEAEDLTIDNPDAVFTNGEHQIHPAYFLFDDRIDFSVDFWASGFTGENYAGYDFGQPTYIDYYSLTSNVDVPGRDAKDWMIQGSNDMTNWVDVDSKTNITFDGRLEKMEFFLTQGVTFRYFRILITKNNGDGWVAIQEMEFGATSNRIEIKPSRDQNYLLDANAGTYSYILSDQNNNLLQDDVLLINQTLVNSIPLVVIQDGPETVAIENPNELLNYYWYADSKASKLLHIGNTFAPPGSGNYFVRAAEKINNSFSSDLKGFAVTRPSAPEVLSDDGIYTIVDPIPNAEYYWYDSETGGEELHIGTSFSSGTMGKYYVSIRLMINNDLPIDPNDIGNITLWADAADIDGDNQLDQGLENSSAYKWKFRVNGQWGDGGWHAYRSNYSNGLGVVELGTVWFQYVDNEPADARTIIITYEENGFSREGSAPFYGLKPFIGRDGSQNKLFSDNISQSTINGLVHINGKAVNPDLTLNDYAMKSLSVVLSQDETINLFAIDEYWEGKIAELIVFDRALEDDEIKGIHAYMRKKWLSTADLASPRTEVKWVDDSTSYESSEEITICKGQNYLGLTEEGTYIRDMKTSEGYDSIVTTTIVFEIPSSDMVPEIEQDMYTLFTSLEAVSYQWYLNGQIIDGATSNELMVVEDGDYQLIIVNEEGCIIESEVYTYIISGVSAYDKIQCTFYPNPSGDYITFENTGAKKLAYSISNFNGQLVRKGQISERNLVVDISSLSSGVYSVRIQSGSSMIARKLVKF